MMTATSGRRLFVPSMRSGPLGSWARMCLGSRRWYSPARRLTWVAQKIFSRKLTYTERSSGMSSTASVRTSRTRDIPSSRLLYRLVPSERRTGGTGCGSSRGGLLPTPLAKDGNGGVRTIKGARAKHPGLLQLSDKAVNGLLPTPLAVSVRHSKRCRELKAAGDVPFHSRANGETRPNGLEDWLEFNGLMPTPVAQDYRRRDPNSRQQGLPEVCQRLLHTPIADGLKKRTGKGQERMRAEDFEAMFPENGGSPGSKDGRASQLNPLFVGEMMGYPLEWLTSPFLSGDGEGRP